MDSAFSEIQERHNMAQDQGTEHRVVRESKVVRERNMKYETESMSLNEYNLKDERTTVSKQEDWTANLRRRRQVEAIQKYNPETFNAQEDVVAGQELFCIVLQKSLPAAVPESIFQHRRATTRKDPQLLWCCSSRSGRV